MNKFLPWFPIITGVLSIVSLLLSFKLESPTFVVIFTILSVVYPIIGLIFSLFLRKKCFEYHYIAIWVVGFVLNLLLFLFYVAIIGFLIFIVILVGRAFGAFA